MTLSGTVRSKAFSAHEPIGQDHAEVTGSDRSFGVVVGVALVLVGFAPLLSGDKARVWALLLAAVTLAIALVAPRLLAPFNKLWLRFGRLLNAAISPIVMAALFFLVLTPYGIALRIFGKNLLGLKFLPQSKSYWIARRPPGPSPKSMKHQF